MTAVAFMCITTAPNAFGAQSTPYVAVDPSEDAATQSIIGVLESLLTLYILCLLPLVLRVVASYRPLAVSDDTSHLKGRYRRWSVSRATGRVLASSSQANTYGQGNISGSVYQGTGTVTGSSYTRTDFRETMRLRLSDGRQIDAGVVNYGVAAQPGDVLSVWYAARGHHATPFAVLNHTTNQSATNDKDLHRIQDPHQKIFALYHVAFLGFISIFLSILTFGIPVILWGLLLILYFLGQRMVRNRFRKSGMGPLWRVGAFDASYLGTGT
ncbi:MAG: hypothetical protein WBX27_20225 [Specibacter sp.]